jgi:hypothetical protein
MVSSCQATCAKTRSTGGQVGAVYQREEAQQAAQPAVKGASGGLDARGVPCSNRGSPAPLASGIRRRRRAVKRSPADGRPDSPGAPLALGRRSQDDIVARPTGDDHDVADSCVRASSESDRHARRPMEGDAEWDGDEAAR